MFTMDLPKDESASSRLAYAVTSTITSDHDDKAENIVRCNGRLFYIYISPSDFHRPPQTTAQYLAFLEVLRSVEEQIDGLFELDFDEWATVPFEP